MINTFQKEYRSTLKQFNSNNTTLMNVEEVKAKLLEVELVREELREWENH